MRENFKYLAENLQHNLPVVAAELFSNSLIPSPVMSNSSDQFEKASNLVAVILSTVESDARSYKSFIGSLDKLGHSDIVKTLTASKDLQAPPTAAYNEVPSFMKESQKPRTSRRNEDSSYRSQPSASKRNLPDHSTGVAKSKSNESNTSGKDSAFSEGQSLLSINDDDYQNIEAGGLLEDVEDSSSSPINYPVGTPGANLDASPSDWNSPIVFSTPSDNNMEQNPSSSTFQATFNAVATSEQVVNSTRVYSSQITAASYYSHQSEKATVEKIQKQQEAEIECWKFKHDLKDEELRKLKEDKQKALLEQDRIVKEKDNKILKLQEDHEYKDMLIAKLESDKDKIKTEMSELEQKCQKAIDMQKIAEQKTLLVLEQYKEKEALLVKELNDVREIKEKAVHERELIKNELIELKLEKEQEMRKLERRNHELEKIELQLRAEIEKQKAEKDREIEKQKIEKDREIAEKDKAFAEQGTKLANSQKELAESKQKLAEKRQKDLEVEMEKLKKQMDSIQMKEKDPE